MSLRQWNTLSERSRFQKYVEFSNRLLLQKIYVEDDDDDDDDTDELMSIRSDSLDSSVDTVEFVVGKTHAYGSFIYKRFEDTTIQWDLPPPLIRDMSERECVNEFRFRKEHLQLLSNKLWTLMMPHLEGTSEKLLPEIGSLFLSRIFSKCHLIFL
jgi:hypothetical protein